MSRRHGKQGVPTSSIIYSPARSARMKKAMKRTEERWAARSGPVTVRKIKPEEKS